MSWLVMVGTAWATVAALLALLLGRTVRFADRMESARLHLLRPDFLPEDRTTSPVEPR
jgi:hypothetical protein